MVIPVQVEVILNTHSHVSQTSITNLVQQYLECVNVRPNTVISSFNKIDHPILTEDVKAIIIEDYKYYEGQFINFRQVPVKWHVYALDTFGPMQQKEQCGDDEEVNLATHMVLPSEELYNLWENLHYENDVKANLLKYAETMMAFSEKGVDPNIVSCNRVILLHGPPGTGKTSLCKALAQKLTIRMSHRYTSGLFIEINSHSLFSKWFSESGKLVTKMFTKIKEIVEDSSVLVSVLIDEVESLAHARNQCVSGNEPSDSIRVVNAVLTQIDQIKRHSNVLILATSNMTEAIDLAFIDRADVKQYLGLPTVPAIFKIYNSCLDELIKANIIQGIVDEHTEFLLKICEKSLGLSGRSLRKIPFIAHALFVHDSCANVYQFLLAMENAVQREHDERKFFSN